MNIRPPVQDFLNMCQEPLPPVVPVEDSITVSAATRELAFAYERFRNTLEPDEEDILRRKSIWRILLRRIPEDRGELVSATAFLQELLRARYITRASRAQAKKIAREFKNVRRILSQLEPAFHGWFLRIVSVSIDRELYDRYREESLVRLMYQDIYSRLRWTDDMVASPDRPIQIFAACHRALFEADDDEITYHYFLNKIPYWKQPSLTNEQLLVIADRLPQLYQDINAVLDHPARQRLAAVLRPAAVPYRMIWDLCQTGAGKFFTDDETLTAAVRSAVKKRLKQISSRMNKRAWHSIIFLFFTKTILTGLIEYPYERFLLGQVHWFALSANIAFHPLLLFTLAVTARLPKGKNTAKIVEHVVSIVTGQELPPIVVRSHKRYGALTWASFAVLYTVLFIAIFWGLFSLLVQLKFSLPAMILFVTFLGIVTFLAARVRRSIDEIRVLPKGENMASLIVSFAALPILEFGGWLTRSIRQLNIILFLMDRVLEAPFKLLIDIAEEWLSFVRERREEIV
jgi:hypothetical protein